MPEPVELGNMRRDIQEQGATVALLKGGVPALTIEAWVRAVRGWAQVEDIDWGQSQFGPRIQVLGTPEQIGRAVAAVKALLPALHAMHPGVDPLVWPSPTQPSEEA